MSFWPLYGLRCGIQSTPWPKGPEQTPGISSGRPVAGASRNAPDLVARCPTQALRAQGPQQVEVALERCIQCQRCRAGEDALPWRNDFAWGRWQGPEPRPLPRRFRRSLQVLYVDAGACGACVNEVRLLDAPAYNMHRLGIFVTASPRDADVLLVAGPITDAMVTALHKAYAAMPEPKRVIGMGVCAENGGIFGRSFACRGGLAELFPVDLWIPGCPPPPLAIIHGLLTVMGWTAAELGLKED